MKVLALLAALNAAPTGCAVKNIAFSFENSYYVACECDGKLVAFDGHSAQEVIEDDDEEDEP
jgi:hypothetical protein